MSGIEQQPRMEEYHNIKCKNKEEEMEERRIEEWKNGR